MRSYGARGCGHVLAGFAASSTAAWIWRFGWDFVPGSASLPVGRRKTAFASVPSILSQLESTKPRSGRSGALGWMAALLEAQSCASS